MNTPLVSVVVATYRREKDLGRALESLIAQDYPALEIVLVDDNGDPGWNKTVAEIAENVLSRTGRVLFQHLVNCPNQGSAEARNVGIRAAKGEYITFLDDDDEYLPQKVSRQLYAMLESKADYCLTDLLLYQENGKLVDRRIRPYLKNAAQKDLLTYHLMYHLTGTDTMMFRKDYLLRIGGFPPIDVGDEFYLMKEAVTGGGKFCYLPGCDVEAYVHLGENGGLSSGEKKIAGENQLYRFKQTLFQQVNRKNRRYIRMRHYAVLAFAEVRRKRYGAFFKNGVLAFLSAPVACVGLLCERAKGR